LHSSNTIDGHTSLRVFLANDPAIRSPRHHEQIESRAAYLQPPFVPQGSVGVRQAQRRPKCINTAGAESCRRESRRLWLACSCVSINWTFMPARAISRCLTTI